MKKSAKCPLWWRIFPMMLLIIASILFFILEILIDHPGRGSDDFGWALLGFMMYIVFPVITLVVIILINPLIGGIFSLLYFFVILILSVTDFNSVYVYIYFALFISGITALYIGIRDLKNKRNQK